MAKRVNINLPNPNSLNLEVKLYGDWQKLDILSTRLAPSIQAGYDVAVEEFSRKILRIVRQALTVGKPPPGTHWEPLSPYTIERYGQHPIYHLTGLYARSIGLFKYKSRTYVGLPLQKKRASNGDLTLNQLAIILEYGTSNNSEGSRYIPPRPVWGPSFNSVGGQEGLKKLLLKHIRSKIQSNTGVKANQVR